MLSIPLIGGTSSLIKDTGKFRATFSVLTWLLVPSPSIPKKVGWQGKTITLVEWKEDRIKNTLTIVYTVENDPGDSIRRANVNPLSMLYALIVLIGLGLVALSLVKLEKIITSPGTQFFVYAIAAVILFSLYQKLSKR